MVSTEALNQGTAGMLKDRQEGHVAIGNLLNIIPAHLSIDCKLHEGKQHAIPCLPLCVPMLSKMPIPLQTINKYVFNE